MVLENENYIVKIESLKTNVPIMHLLKKKKDGDFVHLAAVLKRGHELIPLSAGTSRFLLKNQAD